MHWDCLTSLVLWAALIGCGSSVDQFVVTSRPLNVGVIATPICIAVDPDAWHVGGQRRRELEGITGAEGIRGHRTRVNSGTCA